MILLKPVSALPCAVERGLYGTRTGEGIPDVGQHETAHTMPPSKIFRSNCTYSARINLRRLYFSTNGAMHPRGRHRRGRGNPIGATRCWFSFWSFFFLVVVSSSAIFFYDSF